MKIYMPTIGLEIHAELKTKTKMFCDSKNDANEKRSNVNVCPVCMAHPGTLPVINREAVRHVLRVGTALKGTLADYTEFDRKNYFYPDLPKGYQLSQYEFPLVSGGELSGVPITRVHLEEDTASSMHLPAQAGDENSGVTTIDFNRAGVPLMELVTEPVIHSAEEAGKFARELQLLLRYLDASEANMEKGEMRVEANVSVSRKGNEKGTKVEIKNLNSFRAMERAVAYEIKRQTELLEKGEQVAQETRGWDEGKQATFPQRVKEGSADYRYFPDPDLPSLKISEVNEFHTEELRKEMPELPSQRRERYVSLGLQADDLELFVRNPTLGAYFEEVVTTYPGGSSAIKLASNYLANDVINLLSSRTKATADKRDNEIRDTEISHEIPISAHNFKKIIDLLIAKKISSRGAKELLAILVKEKDTDPEKVAEEKGLFQVSDDAQLLEIARKVLSEHPDVVAEYRGGKETALQYLVGQGMKASGGAANPGALKELLSKEAKGL